MRQLWVFFLKTLSCAFQWQCIFLILDFICSACGNTEGFKHLLRGPEVFWLLVILCADKATSECCCWRAALAGDAMLLHSLCSVVWVFSDPFKYWCCFPSCWNWILIRFKYELSELCCAVLSSYEITGELLMPCAIVLLGWSSFQKCRTDSCHEKLQLSGLSLCLSSPSSLSYVHFNIKL